MMRWIAWTVAVAAVVGGVVVSSRASVAGVHDSVAKPRPWAPARGAWPYRFTKWAVRPDGGAAMLVLESGDMIYRAPGEWRPLLIHQDFASKRMTEVQTVPVGARGSNIQPEWSPDGTQVAYAFPISGTWHVHVWRPADNTLQVFRDREACVSTNVSGCKSGELEWSADGALLFFLARPVEGGARSVLQPDIKAAMGAPFTYLDERGKRVTVREFKPAAVSPAKALPAGFMPAGDAADVVVANTRTGALHTVLSGANADSLVASPDGSRLLVIARSGAERGLGRAYADYFIIPMSGAPRGAHDGDGIEPVLRRVPQFEGVASWSPDSKRIALVEAGTGTAGDIFLLHVASGALTNVTQHAAVFEPGESAVDAAAFARDPKAPGGKFSGTKDLVWSPDGTAVYVTRRARVDDAWRTRLWKVAVSGEVTNLTAGAAFDVRSVLSSEARPGESPTVTALTTSADETQVVSVAAASGNRKVLATLPQGFDGALGRPLFPTRGSAVMFVLESRDAPAEGFVFRTADRTMGRATSVNTGFDRPAPWVEHRIVWRAPSGEERFGLLYVPRTGSALPSVIVQVYPRAPSESPFVHSRRNAFVGSAELFLPPLGDLLAQGYAVFKPDIPVAGGGHTCDDLAANVDRALAAVEGSKLADVSRAAIVGTSFGGWAVNCIIGKTNRFRAAVSIAGIADLISTSFSMVGSVASWGVGGGQTRIGRTIWDAPELFLRESPVLRAPEITTPLLLIHGTLDDQVAVDQSQTMYVALSRLGKQVSLVVYEDAGHGSVLGLADYQRRAKEWITEDRQGVR